MISIEQFRASYPFPLDPYQERAIAALAAGRSVLVAAPTGAGKTVVAEYACADALARGRRCFYTTPIKALSNQKYRDLSEQHPGKVGLLTGDRSIDGDAPLVVMTTEVLRNMLYDRSPALAGLHAVVLDEVHYLADRERGGVWEEVLIQLPTSVQVVALSATVSNAEEFGEWLREVRGSCEVIIEERRPVPLRHHYFVNGRIYPTFVSRSRRTAAAEARAGVPNPQVRMLERQARTRNRVTGRGRRVPGLRLRWPSRVEVVETLAARGWLPAILFVFSRQGCEDAVTELLRAGVRLTDRAERRAIDAIVEQATAEIPDADLAVLGFDHFREALRAGVAAHHAGLVPAFKEAVELAFQRGLIKVVVATETLALGINMPARTVVIERLEKFDGEQHTMLTPGEYTQLTGRAGRRGIDRVGHAVVLYQRDIDFETVAELVGTRSYPLQSSFRPSYNMAVNLLRHRSVEQAETLLGASFAQFQADRAVARTGTQLAELERALEGYARHLHCDRGDWEQYAALRRELSRRERALAQARRQHRRDRVRDALAALEVGDVIHLPKGRDRVAIAAVVGVRTAARGEVRAGVVGADARYRQLAAHQLEAPPAVVGRIALPARGNPRQRAFRHSIAADLARFDVPPRALPVPDGEPQDPTIGELRAAVAAHPCHGCPDRSEHERWQARYDEVRRDVDRLRRDIEQRTGSLVRRFRRIVEVLRTLGYLDASGRPTDHGLVLAGIYGEADLVVAETVRRGLLGGLDAAELAGLAALFVYEPREESRDAELPTPALGRVVPQVLEIADELRAQEQRAGLEPLRELDAGFVAAAWRWTSGADLEVALGELDLSGGDFVRTIKQVADLLGQLRDVTDPAVASRCREAIDAIRRGIVDA